MTLILSGTDGLSDIDGTASTPAIRGTDANTGIFFPAADTIAFAEGGAEAMRIDSSGNVGVGTTSPASKLTVSGDIHVLSTNYLNFTNTAQQTYIRAPASSTLAFGTDGTERARIDSSGRFLYGTTGDSLVSNGFRITSASGQFGGITMTGGAGDGPQWQMINLTDAGTVPNGFRWLSFRIGSGATEIGKIEKTSSTSVAYTTSSDYRLKENIAPITGALSRVAALKPVKWKWKNQNDDGEGFIAHELAEVVPQAVGGEKDAVNEDGSIKPQGVDTSFLVATLTAAIQELKAINDAQAQTIESLTTRIAALEAKG